MSTAPEYLLKANTGEAFLEVIARVKDGDFSARMPLDWTGIPGKVADGMNDLIIANQLLERELARISEVVGKQGVFSQQVRLSGEARGWSESASSINGLIEALVLPTNEMQRVISAVACGDLTRQVSMEACGEVATLLDSLNEMIRNLRETTRQNLEQDWLKTNRERFTRMLQGQRDLKTVSSTILSELAPLVSAQHGVFYVMTEARDAADPVLSLQAGYGFEKRSQLATSFRLGEGLVGQCAKEGKRILLTEVPGDYVRINSGLGAAPPLNIVVLPILFEGSVRAVIELASINAFTETHLTFLDQLTESIGLVLNTLEANTLTETLLAQAQRSAEELRIQQEELRASNEDLGRQAELLAEQNTEAERRNREVEESRGLLEEKAGQLTLSSKYKSEFIANMSHELRTPLNSLLILAEQLEDNPDGNMTATQVEFASVIRSSGNDLMVLLNGILDLAKAESGAAGPALAEVSIETIAEELRKEFGPVAKVRGLEFAVGVDPGCPKSIVTDIQRLRQILKNLLANAFKFTKHGQVSVQIAAPATGWKSENDALAQASAVVAVTVCDTGIGIEPADHNRIFEEFAQADGSTGRLYGGTGLGLTISRNLATMLCGEIVVTSTPGEGSSCTVYLPVEEPVAITAGSAAPVEAPITDQLSARTPTLAPVKPKGVPPAHIGRADLSGTRVLVVDDDFRNLFALTALLERSRANVITAESGAAALAILVDGSGAIDIILMDIMMPVMDGYETITAIRGLDGLADIPIIAVTGKVVSGERERCIAAGANAYVPKPVDTKELLTTLEPWLQRVAPTVT